MKAWAFVEQGGNILLRTIADSERAAMVFAIAQISEGQHGVTPMANDAEVLEHLEKLANGGSVQEITITAGTPRFN